MCLSTIFCRTPHFWKPYGAVQSPFGGFLGHPCGTLPSWGSFAAPALAAGAIRLACLFSTCRSFPARLQRHGALAVWSPELVVLSHSQSERLAAILLILGILERQRARGILKAAWGGLGVSASCAVWVRPAVFHEHHSGMHGPGHMAVMVHIQTEHLHFAIAGCSIGLIKGLSELPTRRKTVFLKAWPVLMIVLGIIPWR